MTQRIFRSIFIVAVSVFLASAVLIMGALYDYFSDVQTTQLKTQTTLAAQGLTNEGLSYFDGLDTRNFRITWISEDGNVLYDSETDSSAMENHLEREEIKQALKAGSGTSSRYSSTLLERSQYYAERLADGSVLRLSIAEHSIVTLALGMAQPICAVFIVAVLLSLLLAYRLAKNIVRPLNELNLDEPLNNEGYDEISPLLLRINSQQKQLKRQANELQKSQDEFKAITDSMSEGLILLNPKGTIISINKSAADLLDTTNFCVGNNILTVNRSLKLQEVLSTALSGKQAEKVIDLHEGRYQVDASPVISGNTLTGIALLIFDVTEKENSEQLRREFTANVSHELRTPLHSISGYAELLKNGMVKDGDIEPVAGKIYDEAQRMVRLVEDIMNLSHLDEGAEDMKKESIDLYHMASSTLRSLDSEAESANVSLELNGEPTVIYGIPQLISGIVYNLCDNAIKYNRNGGKVTVTIKEDNREAILSVSDTGIGIPAEDQGRIFERFYRVDKSHSKEVGGTGLGLSIVKHAAKIHNARLTLESSIGSGTTITVNFPI